MTTITIKQNNRLLILLFTTFILSSIVLIEPAPFDVLLLLVIAFAIFFHYATYQQIHVWPIVCLLLFLLLNILASYHFVNVSIGIRYSLITIYLIISWLGLSGITYYVGPSILPYIFNGYVISATLSTCLGILAYMDVLPSLDFLLQFGRVQGFFKDPNVFGPFLIPPTLYCLWRSSQYGVFHKKGFIFLSLFLLLSFGILLSFSRAAWGNFILSLLLYFFLIKMHTLKRVKTIFSLIVMMIPILYVAITSPKIADLFIHRLGLQAYDDNRFSNQNAAIDYVLAYPLGAGSGQSEVLLPISTHSLYVRLIFETGISGLIIFLCFFLLCLYHAIKLLKITSATFQGYFVIIVATLIGILFNSMFIDTLHWRHTWLLCALPFMKQDKLLYRKDG